MTPEICSYEGTLVAALSAGEPSAEVQRHLRTCEPCREAALVFQYLGEVASAEKDSVPLPSPDLIWWRAQLAEKRRLAAKSVAAIEAVQKIATVVLTALLLIAAIVWGPRFVGSLALPLPVAFAAAVLGVGLAAGVLYAWASEARQDQRPIHSAR